MKLLPAKIDFAQIGAGQFGALALGAVGVDPHLMKLENLLNIERQAFPVARHDGFAQIDIRHLGLGKLGAGQPGAPQVAVEQDRPGEIRARQIGAGQIDAFELGQG